MELNRYNDYRTYLRDELEGRMQKNPSYSLRSFAQYLGVTPQMLSFVLNRKKNISLDTAAKITEKLNLSPEQANYFIDLVSLAKTKNSGKAKGVLAKRIKEHDSQTTYSTLDVSKFKIISDWHHYAILELTQTKNFKSSTAWIAKRLGIKIFEVEQAIERMKTMELLLEDSLGNLVRTELNISANYKAPNSALRKLAKQYLEKAISALEDQTIDERDITNITMSIDPKQLPQAKKMITEFRRKLCSFLEQGERTEVYVFTPALIKISKNIIKEN